jgi:hypothetical protein
MRAEPIGFMNSLWLFGAALTGLGRSLMTMASREEDASEIADQGEVRISHFIPSVELRGSKSQKLRKLDTLIAYLNRLRAALAGDMSGEAVVPDFSIWRSVSLSWPSFGAGIACGALVLLLAIAGPRG